MQNDVDDLIGKDTPAKKAPAKKAPAKKAPAKKAPAKKAPAKKANGVRGKGKFYFPVGSVERETLKKSLLAKVKSAISTKDIAEKIETPTWKVRLAAQELEQDKKLKLKKEGNTLTISPR